MGKQFRDCNSDQMLLLPVPLHDGLPEGHLANLAQLFVQVSRLCRQAGLANLPPPSCHTDSLWGRNDLTGGHL